MISGMGEPIPKEASNYYLNISENCMKMKKFCPRRGMGLFRLLDPLMRCRRESSLLNFVIFTRRLIFTKNCYPCKNSQSTSRQQQRIQEQGAGTKRYAHAVADEVRVPSVRLICN